jgi:hypothetical protein
MPKYYDHVRNLSKRLESYKAGYAKASGYDKWMYGRRVGEYEGFLAEFSRGIHDIILNTSDHRVCSCALMIPDNSKQPFWLHDGHLDIDGKETRSFYFSKYEKDKGPQLVLHCQVCETTGYADEDEDGWPTVPPRCDCQAEEPGGCFEI